MKKEFIQNSDQIKSEAEMRFAELIEKDTNQSFSKQGASLYMKCPNCDREGKGKGLNYSPKKEIAKCFSCDFTASNPINYLMNLHQLDFVEALKKAAELLNIPIETSKSEPDAPSTGRKQNAKVDFYETQLQNSGLTLEDVQSKLKIDDSTTQIINRYSSGFYDIHTGNIVPGDDMILHYITLDRTRTTYYKKKYRTKEAYGKPIPLYRVRHRFPDQHLDKKGNPKKYESPIGSGVQVWLPDKLIQKFENRQSIETLFIDEGEKKADKSTKHGQYSVGIMGISNLVENGNLHPDFSRIITTCGTKNVVFRMDADWQTKIGKGNNAENSVDYRSRQFLTAIRTYKNHFYAFYNNGIELKIYFSYIKENTAGEKGVDDLLMGRLKGKEEQLKIDTEKAMTDPNGTGEFVDCIDITGYSEQKLKELFHLESIERFVDFHKDRIKANGEEFFYSGTKYKLIDEAPGYELAQPLSPEEKFWQKHISKDNKNNHDRFHIDFNRFRIFMQNNGIGRITTQEYPYQHQLVRAFYDQKIVNKIATLEIFDWIIDFLNAAGEYEITNYLQGNDRVLSDKNLERLKNLDDRVNFLKPTKSNGYMFFENGFWEITKDGIKGYDRQSAPGFIYREQLIAQSPTLLGNIPRFQQIRPDVYSLRNKKEGEQFIQEFDFAAFLRNTGNYKDRTIPYSEWTEGDMTKLYTEMLHKMTSIGYLMHKHFNPSVAKAIFLTDNKEDREIGQSHGRSGKSLTSEFLRTYKEVFVIDGQASDVDKDKNLFAGVSEQTDIVYFDDMKQNFPIERLFTPITGVFKVREMYKDTAEIKREDAPKILISSNHSLRGVVDSPSAQDRLHFVGFSDYYNAEFRPSDDFGRRFFDEWDGKQWNMSANFAGACLQAYIEHGLITIQDERIKLNQYKTELGAAFWDWATGYFIGNDATPFGPDKKIARKDLFDNFLDAFPKEKKWIDSRKFKEKLFKFCELKGIAVNPMYPRYEERDGVRSLKHDWGGRLISGGVEYFFFETLEMFKTRLGLTKDLF